MVASKAVKHSEGKPTEMRKSCSKHVRRSSRFAVSFCNSRDLLRTTVFQNSHAPWQSAQCMDTHQQRDLVNAQTFLQIFSCWSALLHKYSPSPATSEHNMSSQKQLRIRNWSNTSVYLFTIPTRLGSLLWVAYTREQCSKLVDHCRDSHTAMLESRCR